MTATIRRGFLIAAIALVPIVGCGAPAARAARSSKAMETKPVVLGAAPARVAVSLPKARSARRLYVVVRGLRVDADPGVLYHLYLDLPAGAKPAANDPRFIGTINFYGVPPNASPDRAFFSFDITDAARKLRSRKDTTVTFVPGGPAAPGAKVTIARVEITEE
jgi:hypothetical protein